MEKQDSFYIERKPAGIMDKYTRFLAVNEKSLSADNHGQAF